MELNGRFARLRVRSVFYIWLGSSPECGDMNAVCACAGAGLAEPGREWMGLKPGGRCEAMLGPDGLGKPFSQPADTRNWASGGSRDGA